MGLGSNRAGEADAGVGGWRSSLAWHEREDEQRRVATVPWLLQLRC